MEAIDIKEVQKIKRFIRRFSASLKKEYRSYNERENYWRRVAHFLSEEKEVDLMGSLVAIKELIGGIDPLTKLKNRRLFEEELKRRITESRRYHFPLVLVLLDIDNFKTLNDEKGHLAGDIFLKKLGKILRESVNMEWEVFRIGGDELAIIMAHASLRDAEILISKIKRRLERILREKTYVALSKPLGVSFGKSGWDEAETIDEFKEKTDVALYREKKLKKNG